MSIPALRHNSVPQKVLNRRALIAFASGICVTEFLTACGEQAHETAPAHAETSNTTDGSSSPHGTESASPEAQAHPTFTKGYSGGSEAPKGEYRPADEKDPRRMSPSPKSPKTLGLRHRRRFFTLFSIGTTCGITLYRLETYNHMLTIRLKVIKKRERLPTMSIGSTKREDGQLVVLENSPLTRPL